LPAKFQRSTRKPPDRVLTISKIRHLALNNHALRRALSNSCYYFSGEPNADDQMQILAMCERRPGTVANERAHRLFYRRLRQSLIDAKGHDALSSTTRAWPVCLATHISK
jgi:hypothetical protein